MMKLPSQIKKYLKEEPYIENNIGMSDGSIYVFENCVLKVEKTTYESNNEYKMLKFLEGKLEVPKVLCFVQENQNNYLLMSKLDGKMAFEEEYLKDPIKLIKLLTSAIKKLWSVDYSSFDTPYTLDLKLEHAKKAIEQNNIRYDLLDEEIIKEFETPIKIYQYLQDNKPQEELVLTHGDYCLPNVFFDNHKLMGFLDLGRAGISDRYQDISLCLRSLKYNLGDSYKEEYQTLFFDELDMKPDFQKLKYYLLLDELF